MNIVDLREAQARFQNRIERVKQSRQELYRFRDSFTRHFDRNGIGRMDVDDYVIGVESSKRGYNFCYSLERGLDGLGRIIGANAFKFGVYYGRTKSDASYKYRFAKKFGDTHLKAFENVRRKLLELLDAGESENLDSVAKNPLSPMFKGKILCTYYPERYLNVFSPEHLNYFLMRLDLDTPELLRKDAVYKREVLVSFKNQDEIMKEWPVDLFSDFLYSEYPGWPSKDGQDYSKADDPLSEYRIPEFPAPSKISQIDLEIIYPKEQIGTRKNAVINVMKTDYEREARKLKRLGDRGEKIVLDFERERLQKAGREDLAKKVDRVSLKSDSFGYDILSFNTDGTKRFIEVKATSMKVGVANFFLTYNELVKAKEFSNYCLYMVYDVASMEPKVWIIGNPFNPMNDNIELEPLSFRITINTRSR